VHRVLAAGTHTIIKKIYVDVAGLKMENNLIYEESVAML
jgi:hypothetical protein